MMLKDLLSDYLDGKNDAIDVIRRVTGMFNPDHAVTILALVCAITRVEQGDLDKETFRSIWMK